MDCQGSLSLVFEINKNSFKLKNLGNLREFVRDELHIPSLKEEEVGTEGSQGCFG